MSTIDTGQPLTHQALLYGSRKEFLAGLVPFIRDGLECGDSIRIAATNRNIGWIRAMLGADARYVSFDDRSQSYRHPVRTLAAVHRCVQAASRAGQRLRLIGEPAWTARTEPDNLEWARYESLVNAALGWADVALMCTYDTDVVDPAVLDEVTRTHPELVVNGATRPSPSYLDPAVFNAECDRTPLPELPLPTQCLTFDGMDQLTTVRNVVTCHASRVGADVNGLDEPFIQAVDEVATSAIEYGGGSGLLRIWAGPQALVCEISDTGAGLRDPLAGRLPAGRSTARGRRLWLARQSCDLLEVRSGPEGTTVRLHLSLP